MTEEDLDKQLREAAPYINDDGFTARLIAKLPAHQPVTRSWRGIILLAVTALGSVLAYSLSDSGRFVGNIIERLAAWPLSILLIFAFGCGLVIGACAVVIAIRRTPEVRELRRLQS